MSQSSPPGAVVIPFGVPDEGRGLGLGLAAVVHSCLHVQGEGVALAQLRGRDHEEKETSAPPVEAYIPPAAWRDIAGRGDGDPDVRLVLTGSFEPPIEGHGLLRLLAFDGRDGRTCASVEAPVDGMRAGASLVAAFERLGSDLGGEIGAIEELRELDWEALESVLRAERCALHDPARGGPHDRLAAMVHFGRAIGDAPSARYPSERLASVALDFVAVSEPNAPAASAALRALERATVDAPSRVELIEAQGVILLRVGRAVEAERRMNAAMAIAPGRARSYALLAQSLRAQSRLDAALATVRAGMASVGEDSALGLEHGMVLVSMGDLDGADRAWRGVLAREPMNAAAFGRLASLLLRRQDAAGAQSLVDRVLVETGVPADMLRHAVQLVIGTEAAGLPRAARIRSLSERWIARAPNDATALVVLARALLALGDAKEARVRLAHAERLAPKSPAAAEAIALRFAIDEPEAELELQSAVRAARSAPNERLGEVAARARRIATLHGSWVAWRAAGVAEGRRGRWVAARRALQTALEIAPGAHGARLELAEALMRLDDAPGAVALARSVVVSEGPSTTTLSVLARALDAADETKEAIETVKAALVLQPGDDAMRTLLAALQKPRRPPIWMRRTLAFLARFGRL